MDVLTIINSIEKQLVKEIFFEIKIGVKTMEVTQLFIEMIIFNYLQDSKN